MPSPPRNLKGVTHTVEVSASSLYEAAVLGMKAFQNLGWSDNPVGNMEVAVQSPAIKHQVPVIKVTNWLRRAGSPRGEVALKTRLKELLGWNDIHDTANLVRYAIRKGII